MARWIDPSMLGDLDWKALEGEASDMDEEEAQAYFYPHVLKPGSNEYKAAFAELEKALSAEVKPMAAKVANDIGYVGPRLEDE